MMGTTESCQYSYILAPLQGITDFSFRTVFGRHFRGFDYALAPFIHTIASERVSVKHVRDIVPQNSQSMRVEPQLLGNTPSHFLSFCRYLADCGFDSVNWNLGCPSPTVTKKSKGSALLNHPDRIRSFLDCILPSLPVALSIKTRLGFQRNDELLRLLPYLDSYPLKSIAIHPRTGRQMFAGAIDEEMFAHCLRLSDHRIIYNGDIFTAASFSRVSRKFPDAGGCMIGRGAIMNPFLTETIRGNDTAGAARRRDRLQDFHDDLVETYRQRFSGHHQVLGRMKEIWSYLIDSFPSGAPLLKRIQKAQSIGQYSTVISRLFSEHAAR
jgi:tRNA-dihydrouridine synthase